MTAPSRPDWNAFRALFPVTERWAYFDHAAVAPLPQPARDALCEWADDVASNGDANWSVWRKRVEQVRGQCAELINADKAEIAIIRNTTEGITLVAEGFPWQADDNVVIPSGEFPSNLFPWRNLASRGVEVRIIPTENERLDLAQLESACDDRTRIVGVSWVGFATGWRNDLDALTEITRRKGVLLFVDAIQGLGVFPLDVQQTPIDFLAADGHKWMLGPEGAGLLYVRKSQLDLLRPFGVGWNSVQNASNYDAPEFHLKDTAARYEGGTYPLGNIAAFGASLNLLLTAGIDNISQRLFEVTDRLCERLQALGADIASCRDESRKSGIVAFTLPGVSNEEIRRRCRDAGVIVNVRGGRLRISPHGYCNDADMDRLINALGAGGAP